MGESTKTTDRRDFLKIGAAAGVGSAATGLGVPAARAASVQRRCPRTP